MTDPEHPLLFNPQSFPADLICSSRYRLKSCKVVNLQESLVSNKYAGGDDMRATQSD
jgi:hypothetical protein